MSERQHCRWCPNESHGCIVCPNQAGQAPAERARGSAVVNAGFLRRLSVPGKRRPTREWVNVQGIRVKLPAEQLGTKEFRDAVREAGAPGGQGWTLQGYCLAGHADPA